MSLSTSIIITSVTLALLQYFEKRNHDQVEYARQLLRDEYKDVLPYLDSMLGGINPVPEAKELLADYDNLVNFNLKSAQRLLTSLFVIFALVVLLHAVHTLVSLDQVGNTIRQVLTVGASYFQLLLDVGLVAVVGISGGHLYRKNRELNSYQGEVGQAIETAKTAVNFARAVIHRSPRLPN